MTMSTDKFKGVIERIYGRFDRRLPYQSVQDDAWTAIKHIPDEAVDWIVGRINEVEKFPSNWVRDFKSLWLAWRAAHPDRCARDPGKSGCSMCDGGELYAVSVRGRMAYDVCCPCAHCRVTVAGSKTVDQLERMGLIVLGTALKARAYVQRFNLEQRGIEIRPVRGGLEFARIVDRERRKMLPAA